MDRSSRQLKTMTLDNTHYYRITTRVAGKEYALDVSPDGSGRVTLAEPAESSGQCWKLAPISDSHYTLRTAYLGDGLSLAIDEERRVCLRPTDPSAGQSWDLRPDPSGTCALINDLAGPQTCLCTNGPGMVTAQQATLPQHPLWTFTALTPVPGQVAVPDLKQAPDIYCPEGCTDFAFYARPVGPLKAVMFFVDFPDAPAGTCSPSDTANHLLGNGRAQQLFSEQSYGACQLTVDVAARLGWRRLAKPSIAYNCHDFASHRQYIAEATALFAGEVNFSDYQFVLIVAPPTAAFPDSPAFNARPGQGVPAAGGEIRLAVTFGQDSYRNSYINLVHEVSHLMGLPDLYPYGGGVDTSRAGCWDIMSDIFHCTTFLGWHRHKNGWLPAERKTYLRESPQERYLTLSPLSSRYGLSMVVLPIDDPRCPSKVFVVELAQPMEGTTNGPSRGGVLVYSVDSTIPTGHSPLAVHPKVAGNNPDHGSLCEAAYGLNDSASFNEGGTSLTLTVLQQFGSCFHLKLHYARQ